MSYAAYPCADIACLHPVSSSYAIRLQIHVSLSGGKTVEVTADPTDTIGFLVLRCAEATGLSREEAGQLHYGPNPLQDPRLLQRLVAGATCAVDIPRPDDARSLAELGIADGGELKQVLRVRTRGVSSRIPGGDVITAQVPLLHCAKRPCKVVMQYFLDQLPPGEYCLCHNGKSLDQESPLTAQVPGAAEVLDLVPLASASTAAAGGAGTSP